MSQTTETTPFRTKIKVMTTNFLQKNRMILLALVGATILLIGLMAVWTQLDSAGKVSFATRIEKSELDFNAWKNEVDSTKKTNLAKDLEAELLAIQKDAPSGYGLAKAWFIQGNYFSAQKLWKEAAAAFHSVFEKNPTSYLAPIALVNAGVSFEEAGDDVAALKSYEEFEKSFGSDTMFAPQVLFTQGRILEAQKKVPEALSAYKKLTEKFAESTWTKLGRDRILLLGQD